MVPRSPIRGDHGRQQHPIRLLKAAWSPLSTLWTDVLDCSGFAVCCHGIWDYLLGLIHQVAFFTPSPISIPLPVCRPLPPYLPVCGLCVTMPNSIESAHSEKDSGLGKRDSGIDSLDVRAIERAATWKIDLLVIPLVGMYCTRYFTFTSGKFSLTVNY